MEKGQKALEQIKTTAGDLIKGVINVVQVDVTLEQSIKAVKEHIETQFGKLDVLINNAGKKDSCKLKIRDEQNHVPG